MEGLLIENGKVQGGPGKIALLLPLSHDQNRGGGEGGTGDPVWRPWGFSGGHGEGEKGEGGQEARFPATARVEADRSGLATRAGDAVVAALRAGEEG